jgi:hypothetical protein
MADTDGSRLNLGSPAAPQGWGRPRGSKNKNNTTPAAAGSSSTAMIKRRPGRPPGTKNKPKVTGAALGPSAPPPASPATPATLLRIFSFFCIAMAQCREIQRLPLNFIKFMDGRELREAVLLKTRNPTRPGETPSGRTAVMGCPRSVRPPLGLRRSKLSNTKNTDER